jgi:hypothetical protein
MMVRPFRYQMRFGAIGENQEKWMNHYSVLVDCIFVALSNGGVLTRMLPDSVLV